MRGWIISHDEYYLERVETHRGKFRDALNDIRALAADTNSACDPRREDRTWAPASGGIAWSTPTPRPRLR